MGNKQSIKKASFLPTPKSDSNLEQLDVTNYEIPIFTDFNTENFGVFTNIPQETLWYLIEFLGVPELSKFSKLSKGEFVDGKNLSSTKSIP